MEVENVDTGSSINESTASVAEPISKGGGDAPTSFDEIESLHQAAERKAQLKDKIESGKPAEKSAKPAKKTKEKTEETQEISEQAEDLEELPEVKTFKTKNGRDDVELRADMEIPVTIDGQETTVSLNELRNGYAGQATVKQRFEQLAMEKQTYEADRAALDNFVGEVFDDAESDPLGAMIKIAERAGLDPVKYQMTLLDALAEHAQKWANMSEHERAVYKYDLENQQLKSRLERTETQNKSYLERTQLDNQVTEITRDLGIDKQTFAENYYDIVDYFESEGLDINQITPELVADYIIDQHNEEVTAEILRSVDPELAEDDEAINTLMSVAEQNPDFTEEDLREIAAEAWGVDSKSAKVSRKLSKSKPDIVNNPIPRNADKTPLSFDELESL